jgi:hypothetical protein
MYFIGMFNSLIPAIRSIFVVEIVFWEISEISESLQVAIKPCTTLVNNLAKKRTVNINELREEIPRCFAVLGVWTVLRLPRLSQGKLRQINVLPMKLCETRKPFSGVT